MALLNLNCIVAEIFDIIVSPSVLLIETEFFQKIVSRPLRLSFYQFFQLFFPLLCLRRFADAALEDDLDLALYFPFEGSPLLF